MAAAIEAFRGERLRYRNGLSNELNLSSTQALLMESLLARLNPTVAVNITTRGCCGNCCRYPAIRNSPMRHRYG